MKYSISKIISHFTTYYNFKSGKFDALKFEKTTDHETDDYNYANTLFEEMKEIETAKPWGAAKYPLFRENDKIVK